jgi:hypothetical protein
MPTNRLGGTGCPIDAAHNDTTPTNATVATVIARVTFHVIERINFARFSSRLAAQEISRQAFGLLQAEQRILGSAR